VSLNHHGNHNQTLGDAGVFMDIHLDCRHLLRISWCTLPIVFPQWWISCMDYCSLSLLNPTSYDLLQHCYVCLATLRKKSKMLLNETYMQVHQNSIPIKRSNYIKQTWCQSHPLLLRSHQGQRKQEHTIHWWHKEAGHDSCCGWLFVQGDRMKLNFNVVWHDLWYLTKELWEVRELRIRMGVWKAIWYIRT